MNIVPGQSPYSSLLRVRDHQRSKEQVGKEASNNKLIDDSLVDNANLFVVEDESSNELIARASQNVDESSIASSLFRSRRELTLKSGTDADNNFDAVLDENTLAKLALLLKFIAGVQGSNINDLKFQFIKLFPDESDQVVILRKLLKRENLDKTTRANIELLLEDIIKNSDKRRLKAGINVSLKAKLFGKALDVSPQLLRSAYREFIESDGHEIETYQNWITVFGYDKRKNILAFVEGALLNDIDSVDPSCSLCEFGNFLYRLCQLKKLRTLDVNFITNLLSCECIQKINACEKTWLLFLMSILQDALCVDDFLKEIVGEKLILNPDTVLVNFYQKVLTECMGISVEFFKIDDDKIILENEIKKLIEFLFKKEILNSHGNVNAL